MKIADIIIPHHDRHDHLYECLKCLPNDKFNIHIISGGSFAHNCNKGAEIAETDNLIFLNDDTRPTIEVLEKMCAMQEDIVGAAQHIPKLNKNFYGIYFRRVMDKVLVVFSTDKNKVSIPNGFFFRVKSSVWKSLGGLDEAFVNGGEDSDFGFRALERGYNIGYIETPTIHEHNQSKDRLKFHVENKELLGQKWPDARIIELLKLKKEPMNVLVATNHLDRLGGSETWTYAVAKELERLGHKVDVFTLARGIVSDKLNTVEKPREEYDLILINHNTTLAALKEIRGFKIYTQHGAYCAIERAQAGAKKYVAISEEVMNENKEFKFEIIRNGIDCERFKPVTEIGELKKVLSMCQGAEAQKIVAVACQILGLEVEFIERNVWNVEDKINGAQLVISLGRGAYEAMACGRAVITFDKRVYINTSAKGDGIVTAENWKDLATCNFSGRKNNRFMDAESLAKEIKKYSPEMGKVNRDIALNNFNIKNTVAQYLNIYGAGI